MAVGVEEDAAEDGDDEDGDLGKQEQVDALLEEGLVLFGPVDDKA